MFLHGAETIVRDDMKITHSFVVHAFMIHHEIFKNPEIRPFRVLQENSGNHVSFYHALEAQENQTLFSKAMLL